MGNLWKVGEKLVESLKMTKIWKLESGENWGVEGLQRCERWRVAKGVKLEG